MFKNKFWQVVTILTSSYLMMGLLPELRILGLLILSMGMETWMLLTGIQLVAVFGGLYRQQFIPVAKSVNYFLEKHDPFFFIPSIQQLKKFPQIAAHSVPFMLTGFVFIFSSEGINAS